MKFTPVVSVIVTTKNEARNIGRFLKSVKNQTYKHIEILVVDNHSTDETLKIAKNFTSLVYTYGPERSAQRNFGAHKAKGRYLLFLDADMEVTPEVIAQCVDCIHTSQAKAITIAEKTVGDNWLAQVRRFEREMYMGNATIEVPRFFDRKAFMEFGGYDVQLTGPEDFDLPYRLSKKYSLGRIDEYIWHHEEGLTLSKLLAKKFYYASQGARYARKHPELILTQGNLLFRLAYLKNWRKFTQEPLVGLQFILVRILETSWAVSGYIKTVGVLHFVKDLWKTLKI